jgi:3-oxoadipyl-CoA thiolase
MKAQYGVESMPETAENLAEQHQITRADQDAFALRSQQRAGTPSTAASSPMRSSACTPKTPRASRSPVERDEHPRPDDDRGLTRPQSARSASPAR